MKVALIFPPQWTAAQPYFGLTAINGQLRRAGYDVRIWDLNLEFMEFALGSQAVRLSVNRLQSELSFLEDEVRLRLATGDDESDRVNQVAKKLTVLEGYLANSGQRLEALASEAPAAVARLRSAEGFYNPVQFIDSMLSVDEALKVFSLPYYPSEVSWNNFVNPTCSMNLEPLVAFSDDRLGNPFWRFFERRIKRILDDGADLIAVSIASFSQLLPGLTVTRMLRQQMRKRADEQGGANPHLGVGGNFFSRLRKALCEMPAFFEAFCESVLIGEGEGPVLALARALDPARPDRNSLDDVPNLVYFDAAARQPKFTFEEQPPKMDDLAFQELSGFPLDRYLSPDRVVCIRASKGCYWGKCTFCDSHYGLSRDVMQIDRLVEELRHLKDTYGVRHFEFIDQCISPEYLGRMCDALIAADLGIRWFCNGRTEQGMSRELLAKARQAGATMIMWGVESASSRLLKLMQKGVSATGRMTVLRDATDVGIWNFAYLFFGFPTESEQEVQATIGLIRDNTDVIHSYGRSVFTLGKHSPLMQQLDQHGILDYVEDDQALSTNLSFKTTTGLSAARVLELCGVCMDESRKAYGDPLWMALRTRENLHLYLARHGPDFVRGYRLSDEAMDEGQPEFSF